MDTISPIGKKFSWKDCLLRNGPRASERTETINNEEGEEDFELLESDIVRSSINGIPSIHFSERVNQLLIKDMARTVVIKLLGRNIGYSALYNTVWVTIGKVVKLDFNTDAGVRGRFTRMTVCMNLEKPLVSQVLVTRVIQQVKYEYLPTVCFSCGHYSHIKEFCPTDANGAYGSWMLVERQGRCLARVVKVDDSEGIGASGNSKWASSKGPSKEVDSSSEGPNQKQKARSSLVAHGQGPHRPTEGSKPGANTDQQNLGPTKPAEKMSPSRGKSEGSTKGGLEMNPKDGEGPNEILARAVTKTPTEGIFDPSRHSAVVFKENNRHGFLASAPEVSGS
ncbi:hypothetical protein Godav_013416 [Gossypium davidsonii]|uniref:CCHC-type domain-containing protein n=1 Tax=Gossypium davidsonii TaxID=34287 RepID=A0A7J8RG97_GOSDV|nr:hypothetical protein [Gossypium davidsonii]